MGLQFFFFSFLVSISLSCKGLSGEATQALWLSLNGYINFFAPLCFFFFGLLALTSCEVDEALVIVFIVCLLECSELGVETEGYNQGR